MRLWATGACRRARRTRARCTSPGGEGPRQACEWRRKDVVVRWRRAGGRRSAPLFAPTLRSQSRTDPGCLRSTWASLGGPTSKEAAADLGSYGGRPLGWLAGALCAPRAAIGDSRGTARLQLRAGSYAIASSSSGIDYEWEGQRGLGRVRAARPGALPTRMPSVAGSHRRRVVPGEQRGRSSSCRSFAC